MVDSGMLRMWDWKAHVKYTLYTLYQGMLAIVSVVESQLDRVDINFFFTLSKI